MKLKILISLLLIFGLNINIAYCACRIKDLGKCRADIGSGINDKLDSKIMPNNLNKLKMPKNSFDNRSQLGQPQIPSNINLEPAQEEQAQPYDANCQFGNCINRGDTGDIKKR